MIASPPTGARSRMSAHPLPMFPKVALTPECRPTIHQNPPRIAGMLTTRLLRGPRRLRRPWTRHGRPRRTRIPRRESSSRAAPIRSRSTSARPASRCCPTGGTSPRTTSTGRRGKNRTSLFRSDDAGKTWRPLTFLLGQRSSTLFVHNKALYIMGTSGEYSSVVIRRSDDGGQTWTEPADERTGLLHIDGPTAELRGDERIARMFRPTELVMMPSEGGYCTAPVPLVVHAGRIWRAMEDNGTDSVWVGSLRAMVCRRRSRPICWTRRTGRPPIGWQIKPTRKQTLAGWQLARRQRRRDARGQAGRHPAHGGPGTSLAVISARFGRWQDDFVRSEAGLRRVSRRIEQVHHPLRPDDKALLGAGQQGDGPAGVSQCLR